MIHISLQVCSHDGVVDQEILDSVTTFNAFGAGGGM